MAKIETVNGNFRLEGGVLKANSTIISTSNGKTVEKKQFFDYIVYKKGLLKKGVEVEVESGYMLVGDDYKKLSTNKLVNGKNYIIKKSFDSIFWGSKNISYKDYRIQANGTVSIQVKENIIKNFIDSADTYGDYDSIHERCNLVINEYINQRLTDSALSFEDVDISLININLRSAEDQNKAILNEKFEKYGLEIKDFSIALFNPIKIEVK